MALCASGRFEKDEIELKPEPDIDTVLAEVRASP
jgi:hypothetical protein